MWRTSKYNRIEEMHVFRSGQSGYVPIGLLIFEGGSSRRIGRFAYSSDYLAAEGRRPLDPIGLPLGTKWRPAAPGEVHLAFHDAGPDGWGKGILSQVFPELELGMPEFLALGGLSRTGDLAFGSTPEAPERWTPRADAASGLVQSEDVLEEVLIAAENYEGGEASADQLAQLFIHSSDIGGARPKARIRVSDKEWIAKFSTWDDRFDNPRAEAVCLDFAEAAGLRVPDRELRVVSGRSVLLISRFDRSSDGARLSYLSAGTLLSEPAHGYATSKTYSDIASAARRIGVQDPEREMFRRLLVNAYLRNTDDHLRNHAFIHDGAGWRLSPVFDVVPHPSGTKHVCAPAPGISRECNPSIAFASYAKFGLSTAEATSILVEIHEATSRIPDFFDARGVSRRDREMLLACFGLLPRPITS
ncbi:dormancy and Sporulation [Methylobacterium phyllosphaerae]|uniref:Dormancy and Sporulation n=1 Tax=Methylobacterium phyllosphaerae TaxID=418223 RepID=A0AAE8HWN1_9HYPH|nr:dormancy and Sporulation [Methylobacterium phyllosphaerae]SFH52212.1 serine/threonine-protein kinase HipA [Methylobacterium phyllosphaerae]